MEQLSFDLEKVNLDLIDSNIKTNIFADNTNALAMSLAMSPRNEISDLSHSLLCLADQDFEEYVLALRTLRAVSKSFGVISKVKPMDHVGGKVEIPFEPIENKTEKKQYVKRTNKVLKKDKILNCIKEFLKDMPNSGFNCINYVIKEVYGEDTYSHRKAVTIHPIANQIVNKNNGIWSLK
jgi:hypothetical protein